MHDPNEFEREEPTTPYGRAQWSEAELELAEIGRRTRTLERMPALVLVD